MFPPSAALLGLIALSVTGAAASHAPTVAPTPATTAGTPSRRTKYSDGELAVTVMAVLLDTSVKLEFIERLIETGVKAATSLAGLPMGGHRAPLTPPSDAAMRELANAMSNRPSRGARTT